MPFVPFVKLLLIICYLADCAPHGMDHNLSDSSLRASNVSTSSQVHYKGVSPSVLIPTYGKAEPSRAEIFELVQLITAWKCLLVFSLYASFPQIMNFRQVQEVFRQFKLIVR